MNSSGVKASANEYGQNNELLLRYREGDTKAGDRLAELNIPLVYSIARRFMGRGVELDELVECGTVGLVKAMKTFDFSHECAFSTYAVPLIFGEIRRFLRDDGLIKVSRDEKKLSAILNKERERRSALGEDTGIAAIARAVGVSAADAASALFAGAPVRSLDERAFEDDDSTTLGCTVCDEDEELRSFERVAIRAAIEKLDDSQRKLIILRYFRDYSQCETARALGLTQVKVSREEKKIMAMLRQQLT